MNILLDCDGVLLEWRESYIDWLRKHNLWVEDHPHSYDLSVGMKYPELSHTLSEIYNETYHLGKLSPTPGAIESLHKLYNAGARLHVVSSYTDQYEAMKTRERNLENVFGSIFQTFTALPLGHSKHDYVKVHRADSIFIEDSPTNISDGIRAGLSHHRCFLFAQPYNLDHPFDNDVFRGNWRQITQRILGEI